MNIQEKICPYSDYTNKKEQDKMKRILMALGVILWVGALSPEIFMKSGGGCIFDENGEALTQKEADAFMEEYFFEDSDAQTQKKVTYKFALSKLFQ